MLKYDIYFNRIGLWTRKKKKKLAQELKSQHRDFWQVLEDLKGISLDSSAQGIGDKQALKSELKAQYELASDVLHVLETEPPTRSVEYANRVLAKNELAAYGREFNTISQNTKNGIYNTEVERNYLKSGGNIVHEVGHRDLHMAGAYELPMSLEQNHKCVQIDEIAQNLKEVLAYRQRLRLAKTDEEKAEVKESCIGKIGFYQKAVDEGKIDPMSNNPDAFKQEMEFIFNGVSDYWLKTYGAAYGEQCRGIALDHFKHQSYEGLLPNEANYEAYKKTAFTIGGFDFSQFAQKEFDAKLKCDDDMILKIDKAIQAGVPYQDIADHTINVFSMDGYSRENFGNVSKMQVRDDMSLSEQYQLAMYQALVEKVKIENKKELEVAGNDPEKVKRILVDSMPDIATKLRDDVYHDNVVKSLLDAGINPASNPEKFNEEMSKICMVNGVDVLKTVKESRCLDEPDVPYFKKNENLDADDRSGKICSGTDYFKYYEKQNGKKQSKLKEACLKRIDAYVADINEMVEECKQQNSELLADESWIKELAGTGDRTKPIEKEFYYGAPKYENKETLEHIDVVDFTLPILQVEYQAKVVKQKFESGLENSTDEVKDCGKQQGNSAVPVEMLKQKVSDR